MPDGLRNVVGTVRGREPGYIVVGAHYDTKDIPGFVGANDGASGTAVAAQLARTLRRPRHTIQFVFFDGEESPARHARTPSSRARPARQQGGRAGASATPGRWCCSTSWATGASAIAARGLLGRPASGDRLRAAAERVGAGAVFPAAIQGGVLDDHLPFLRARGAARST